MCVSPDYPSPSELYQDPSGGSPVACLSVQRSPRMPPLLDAPVFGEEEEQPPLWCMLYQLWEISAICEERLWILELDVKQLGLEDWLLCSFLFLSQGRHFVTGKRTVAVTRRRGSSSLTPSGHGFLGPG